MVPYSGLSLMQKSDERLLKQAKSKEHGILTMNTYEVTENSVKEVCELIDERYNQIIVTKLTIYRLFRNNSSN